MQNILYNVVSMNEPSISHFGTSIMIENHYIPIIIRSIAISNYSASE